MQLQHRLQETDNTAVSAADSTAEGDPGRKLDVVDVKAPVKAINFSNNKSEAWSFLWTLL